jgi:hypothetical protein
MKISRLDKIADTDRFIFYVPALSDRFAVFLSNEGQTLDYREAMQFRRSEAYDFRSNWEKANPAKGHLIMLPAEEHYPTVEVIPVGYLDSRISDDN